MKLQTKFFFGTTFLVSTVVVGIGVQSAVVQRENLKAEMQRHHRQLAEQWAALCRESLYQDDLVLLNYIKVLKQERGFVAAAFLDADGHIRVHSAPQMSDTLVAPNEPETVSTTSTLIQAYTTSNGDRILDAASPVVLGDNRVGSARLYLNNGTLEHFLDETYRKNLMRLIQMLIGFLLLGFAGAYALARTLIKPIAKVMEGMRRISAGKLEPINESKRQDELGVMEKEMNATINKLNELEEMKRDFAAGITHDLKAPIKSIDGFAAMLLDGLETQTKERQRDYLVTIRNNAYRLLNYIENLLVTARIESKRDELNLGFFDLRKVLAEEIKLFEPVSKEKNVALHLNVPAAPLNITADREKITNVMTNLISNAFKFTHAGSVTVTAFADAHQTRVHVADTGLGIPAEHREKVFDKFFRSASNAKQAKGAGLGLYIVKGFIDAHGGNICVKPNPNGGTVFEFTLPHNLPSNP